MSTKQALITFLFRDLTYHISLSDRVVLHTPGPWLMRTSLLRFSLHDLRKSITKVSQRISLAKITVIANFTIANLDNVTTYILFVVSSNSISQGPNVVVQEHKKT